MDERLRVAIVSGCLFVIGLHLQTGARLLREVWRGPYGEASGVDASLVSPAREVERREFLASANGPGESR